MRLAEAWARTGRKKPGYTYTRAEEKYNGKKVSESNRQRIFSRRQRSFLNAGCFSPVGPPKLS